MAAKQGFDRKRPGRSDRNASPRPSFGVREAVALTVGALVSAVVVAAGALALLFVDPRSVPLGNAS